MALPTGVTYVTNIQGKQGAPGRKGDTGSIAFATAATVPWTESPTVTMVGPESARGAHFDIPLPMPGPELLEVRDEAVAARDQAEVFAAGVVQLQDETMAQVTADDASMFMAQANQRFSMGRVGVSDFVNSWWCVPRSVYDPLRGMQYQGGVRRDGTIEVAAIDTRRGTAERVALGKFESDDHNVPALLVEDDLPPIVAYTRHALDSIVRVKVGTVPHDIESLVDAREVKVFFPATCTYAHLIRRPTTNTLALITRSDNGWQVAVSHDWGASWGAPRKWNGMGYQTFKQHGHIVHYALTHHPTSSYTINLWYCQVDTITGEITKANGTVIGNLWTDTEPLTNGQFTQVDVVLDSNPAPAHNTFRLFDVGPTGSLAAMRFRKDAPELGGQYGVYRFQTGNIWAWEPLIHSGVPVGYYASSYVGGMIFGGTDDIIYLAREDDGVWTHERWERESGVWSRTDTIIESDTQVGRPQIPWGAEGRKLFSGVQYFQYAPENYTDYYGDQIVMPIRADDVEPTPPLPPVGPWPGPVIEPVTDETFLPSVGALMLVDPTNTEDAWPSGVPTGTVPNLATGGTLDVSNTVTGTDAILARTPKGGLGAVVSQVTDVQNRLFAISDPVTRAHMTANPTHSYYISMWGAVLRETPGPGAPSQAHRFVGPRAASWGDSAAVRLASGNNLTAVPSANRVGVNETGAPAPLGVPVNVSGAWSQIVAPAADDRMIMMGVTEQYVSLHRSPSWVLYRAYIEDLTLSGRTYAEVANLDARYFTQEFGPGGRYHDDTLPDVSILP